MTARSRASVMRDSGVTLLWLESASTGTASRLHLDGTIDRLNTAGILIHSVISAQDEPRTKSILERLTRLSRLLVRGVVASRRGVLFARFHPFLLPVLIAWRLRGGVTIVSVQGAISHADMDGVPLARLWARLGRRTLNQADGVVTVTEGLGETLRQALADPTKPLTVIPNGVSIALNPSTGWTPPGYDYVVFLGNLASWQGLDQMLAALARPEWPSELRLVVIGDGSQADMIHEHSNPLLVSLGRLPHNEALAWLSGAVASLSMKDPGSGAGVGGYWPFKILEAASLGVPTIVSEARGLPEMAQQLGSCVVCRYGDAEELASSVRRVHSDPELRRQLARSGRANVERFSWSATSQPLAMLIDEVAASRALTVERSSH